MNEETIEINGIYYKLNGDEAIVTSEISEETYTSTYEGVIIIPSTIEYEGKKYNVTHIEENAFSLSRITDIFIPNSVIELDDKIFDSCLSLESITLPRRFDAVRVKMAKEAGILVHSTNYDIEKDGIYYKLGNGEAKVVHMGVIGMNDIIIPSYFGIINIPASIEFEGIKYNVTEIDDYAFCNSNELTDVILPFEMREIGSFAFMGCTNLKSITIPQCEKIGVFAFDECFSLESITCFYTLSLLKEYPPRIDENTFSNYGVLHVLPKTKNIYESKEYWNQFKIVEDASAEEWFQHILDQCF